MSELPRRWVSATLQDVATWSSGGTPSRSKPAYYVGAIPWFKTGELGPRVLTSSEEHISEDAIGSSSAKVFPKGSVALAMYGATIGKTSIFGIDAATNQACAVGIPDATSAEFLYYFLVSQEKAFIDAGKGGAQPNISQSIVKAWPLLLPPAAEQTRIVEKLEELLSDLDAGVAELKAAQKKLGRYRQSLLKAAVEGALTAEWRKQNKPEENGAQLLQRILTERRTRWEAKQLAKFAEQGKTPPKDWQKKYPEPVQPDTSGLPELPEGWVWASLDQLFCELRSGSAETSGRVQTSCPILKSSAVRQGTIDFEALNFIEEHQSRPENYLQLGDVLITRLSGSVEYVGCCAVVEQISAKGIQYPDRVFCGKLPPSMLRRGGYLVYCFRSAYARKRIEAAAKSTAGHKRISMSDLHPFPIPIPPICEIHEVCGQMVEALRQVDGSELAAEKGLKQSAAQRQNILRVAFAGQLVPQDPSDEPASVLLERIRAERAERDAVKKPRGHKAKDAA